LAPDYGRCDGRDIRGNLTLDTIDNRACPRLRGDIRLENSGGFVQAALDVKAATALDASAYQGILLDVYGNNEVYNLHLRTEDVWLPWQSYRASFHAAAGWRTIRLPFSGFEGCGNRNTDKRIVGLDISGDARGKTYWYAQLLWNSWDGFLEKNKDYNWWGGFLGADYIPNDFWAFSALYNYADADDLSNTDTIYEGIDINSLSLTASYYFMRNVKGIAEVNIDFLGKDSQKGTYFTGHLTKEHYILFGFDAAF